MFGLGIYFDKVHKKFATILYSSFPKSMLECNKCKKDYFRRERQCGWRRKISNTDSR